MFLGIAENAINWFQAWYHILGFVLVFVSLGILLVRKLILKLKKQNYTAKTDITLKASAFFVMLIACILAIL